MDVNELSELFLSHWPESYNPHDQRRFVRWAIAAHRRNLEFPLQAFQSNMNERAVRHYQAAFDIVGYTLDEIDADSQARRGL